MQRLTTTVVTVVGTAAEACVRSFQDARNVAAIRSAADDPTERAVEAWRTAAKSHRTYTLHDADPLVAVADAWATAFRGGPRGDLEVAVAETLGRHRAGSIGLPDFYLVLDPDDLPPACRDWYLGVLHRAAPNRIVPVASERAVVNDALARLQPGRWWPAIEDLLAGLDLVLPDQVLAADAEDHARLLR